MLDLALFTISISGLAATRNWIQKRIQAVVLLLGGSKSLSIRLYSLIFLPGVIIHELSHFLVASMLNVPTGNIKIFPDSDPVDGRVALGSVQVAKTDFIRASLVGMAPFIIGCLLLYAATAILFGPLLTQPTLTDVFNWLSQQSELLLNPITWLWFYFIIAVSNTMFMSKEDTKSLPFLGFIILLILTAIFISGQAQAIAQAIWPPVQSVIRALGTAFSLTLIIDLLSLTLLYGLQRLLQIITRKKIIFH